MIRYVHTCDGVKPEQLRGFFGDWPDPPTPQTHLRLLEKSEEIVLAIDQESKAVVGFITAITDRILSAYIPLLEVLPQYRRRGIGRELARRMLDRLKGLYMVDLVCDPELEPFYTSLGMRPGTAMMLRNREHQSGRPANSSRCEESRDVP